jgi:hypothetical protein
MSKQESSIEWYQAKARVPKDLHQKSRIALAILDKSLVEVVVEALERAIAEAGVK